MKTRSHFAAIALVSVVAAGAVGALASCGPAIDDDDPYAPEETGPAAPDEIVGADVGAEIDEGDAPSVASDARTDARIDVAIGGETGGDDALSTDPDIDGVDVLESGGPVAGSKMMTTRYAGFHVHASSSSSLLSVAPHNGVHDSSLHLWSNSGLLPPGQPVVVVESGTHNGYRKVKYAGKTGYVSSAKLAWHQPGVSSVAFAKSARSAFFKHQIHRVGLNKDGPSHSGNCAPTSLAMAAHVLGKEPAGLSIEQSIHRVRKLYDPGLHEGEGSSRSDIKSAAHQLGLNVHDMATWKSPSAALTRLHDQLAMGRVVVLLGEPGKPNAGPTAYESAQTAAYHAAIAGGASLFHSSYNYNGKHAIFVLGLDADGRYLVGDPFSEVGFLAMHGSALKDFMTRWGGGTGISVW